MSKLEQLISELCPNGVDYVHLWEVTVWDKRFNSVDRKKQKQIITYPYLLASNLFNLEQPTGNVFLLSTGEKTGWTNEKLAGNYLRQGEVVAIPWGKSRPLKEVIKYYKGKFNAYQRTYVLTLKDNRWEYSLFKYQLERWLTYLQNQSKGTNTRYLTLGILKSLYFIIPPVSLQCKFALFSQMIDKQRLMVHQSLDELEILKKSLMQEYFK